MLLLETERYLVECSLKIGTIPEDGPDINFKYGIDPLKEVIDKGNAIYEMNGNTASLIIEKYIDTDNYIIFLLKYSDSKKSDPSFSHLKTGKSRLVEKTENEGIAVTAHLLISKSSDKDIQSIYPALLEEIPGVTRSVISRAFTKFLSENTDYTFNRKGAPKGLKCRPKIELELNMSHTIEDCLKDGLLTGFVAIQHSKENKLDEEGELKISEHRIVISARKSKREKATELIKKAIGYASEKEYSKLTVKYKDENQRQKSLDINTSRSAIGESYFSKVKKAKLRDPIKDCQPDFHKELCEKMKNYLDEMN